MFIGNHFISIQKVQLTVLWAALKKIYHIAFITYLHVDYHEE